MRDVAIINCVGCCYLLLCEMLLYIANSHPPENNIRMVAMIRIHTAVTCTCLVYTVHSTVISCTFVCVCVCVYVVAI